MTRRALQSLQGLLRDVRPGAIRTGKKVVSGGRRVKMLEKDEWTVSKPPRPWVGKRQGCRGWGIALMQDPGEKKS